MRPDPEAPTRERILFFLKTRGPQTASQLAKRLSMTAMGARQHLFKLVDEGLIDHRDERGGVGRPRRIWSLTEGAQSRFPDAHSDLTLDLLAAVRSTFGEEGLEKLVSVRSREQERSYRERLPGADSPLSERVAGLVAIRREEGYMAESSRRRDGSFLLVENHCPICAAAAVCQGICRDELALFRKVLGRDVTVERVDHILAGARRCAYEITPKG